MTHKSISFSDLISLTEASNISGLSSAHLRRLVGEKTISGDKIGRNWVTSKQAVLEYIKQERRPGRKVKSLDYMRGIAYNRVSSRN